jgi:integrase
MNAELANTPGNRPPRSPHSDDRGLPGTTGAGVADAFAAFGLDPDQLTERALYRLGRTAPSTLRAYRSDWADFRDWCASRRLTARPAEPATITGYLAYLATLVDDDGAPAVAHATLERRVAAIAYSHGLAAAVTPTGDPIVRDALEFWAHQLGTGTREKAKPLTTRLLRQVVEHQPASRAGARNRALLLIGFAAALRRSELAALDVEDFELVDEGLVITIRHSKTDTTATGELIGIPYGAHTPTCPVRAHTAWLDRRGAQPGSWLSRIRRGDVIDPGRAGIGAAAVNTIIQTACRDAGRPAGYSGHSLRAGFITSAAEAGVPQWAIMAHARHRSILTNTRYIRRGTIWQSNAAAQVGL